MSGISWLVKGDIFKKIPIFKMWTIFKAKTVLIKVPSELKNMLCISL